MEPTVKALDELIGKLFVYIGESPIYTDSVYVIISYSCKESPYNKDGVAVTLHLLGPGNSIGKASPLDLCGKLDRETVLDTIETYFSLKLVD